MRAPCWADTRAAPQPYAERPERRMPSIAARTRPATAVETWRSGREYPPGARHALMAPSLAQRTRPVNVRGWRRARADTPPGAAQAGVERVAQGVAQQVRAEHGEADGDAREQDQPRRLLRVLRGRHRQHAAPRRVRLGHAD